MDVFLELIKKPYSIVLKTIRLVCSLLVILEFVLIHFKLGLPIIDSLSTFTQIFIPLLSYKIILFMIALGVLSDFSGNIEKRIIKRLPIPNKINQFIWLGVCEDLILLVWTVLYCLITLGTLNILDSKRFIEKPYDIVCTIILLYSIFISLAWACISIYNRNYRIANRVVKDDSTDSY